jgi:hypothetical protein
MLEEAIDGAQVFKARWARSMDKEQAQVKALSVRGAHNVHSANHRGDHSERSMNPFPRALFVGVCSPTQACHEQIAGD